MVDGPIQVVLNPSQFREVRISRRIGGTGKDFYEGSDREFLEHKVRLLESVNAILRSTEGEQRVNLLVKMRPDALAKSHRPFQFLFDAARAAHVGTADYGEMIFAISYQNLLELRGRFDRAEINVGYRDRGNGEAVYWPSRARSEASAISEIREWRPDDERGYELRDASEWLSSGDQVKFVVELLDLPEIAGLRQLAVTEVERLRQLAAESNGWFTLLPSTKDKLVIRAAHRDEGTRVEPNPVSGSAINTAFSTLQSFEASSVVRTVRLEDRLEPVVFATVRGPALSQEILRSTPRISDLPIVGVVDGGVSGPFHGSSSWVAGRADFLAPSHRGTTRVDHGTMIASLLAFGSSLNGEYVEPNEDCRIYDVDLFPEKRFQDSYYQSLDDFVEQLRSSVRRARENYGVRIFTFSYNLQQAPGTRLYSVVAEHLDDIASELDVLFVISAGNLSRQQEREEWPNNPGEAVALLARIASNGGLGTPAESIVNLSVGAVNPPGVLNTVPGAPTRYTRRATPIPSTVKPDFAAPGGSGGSRLTGLTAIDSTGSARETSGTSFSVPLVARHLATLDNSIVGEVSRELLVALAVHSAKYPDALTDADLIDIAPSFVGHGMLGAVSSTLEGGSDQMTLVLSDIIRSRACVQFPFRWPDSLVNQNGGCRGRIKLTLVTQPIIDHAHGAERVRVNLDAGLKQSDEDGRFHSKVEPTHQFFSGYRYANELRLSTEFGKWFPIKSYERAFPRGIGKSTQWRLDIDYLTRASEAPPLSGVRFAAILTIADPNGEAPVFEEMRASLSQIGVTLQDLRTAVSIGVQA